MQMIVNFVKKNRLLLLYGITFVAIAMSCYNFYKNERGLPSRPWSTIISESGGSIDTIPPKIIKINDELHIAGWAFDPQKKIPVQEIIVYDNQRLLPASIQLNILRPDVAKALGNVNLSQSGWDIKLKAGILSKGSHLLTFYAVLGNNEFAQLTSGIQASLPIEITD
jgi:hypothetical protein